MPTPLVSRGQAVAMVGIVCVLVLLRTGHAYAPWQASKAPVVQVAHSAAPHRAGAMLGALSLNEADSLALVAVPGIGPSTAHAILVYRAAHGPFASLEALAKVPGLGNSWPKLAPCFQPLADERPFALPLPPRPKAQQEPIRPAPLRLNLNTATQQELEQLPGIGPVTALAILQLRRSTGRFTSLRQLRTVKGIGPKTLEKLAPLVCITDCPPPVPPITPQTPLELNTATLRQLVAIPGIGEEKARSILEFRAWLGGGYHHKRQLEDVIGLSWEDIRRLDSLITIDTSKASCLPLHSASDSLLWAHPYTHRPEVLRQLQALRNEQLGSPQAVLARLELTERQRLRLSQVLCPSDATAP